MIKDKEKYKLELINKLSELRLLIVEKQKCMESTINSLHNQKNNSHNYHLELDVFPRQATYYAEEYLQGIDDCLGYIQHDVDFLRKSTRDYILLINRMDNPDLV
jgi:hypothetical protein